LNKTVA